MLKISDQEANERGWCPCGDSIMQGQCFEIKNTIFCENCARGITSAQYEEEAKKNAHKSSLVRGGRAKGGKK